MYTPRGNVKAHQPRLNGNLLVLRIAETANINHRVPNPHKRRPDKKPRS